MTQRLAWKLPQKPQPGQFHHLHRFIVVAAHSGTAVEGHYSESAAQRAAGVLAQHNKANGHPTGFLVEPLPVHLHNLPPSRWH